MSAFSVRLRAWLRRPAVLLALALLVVASLVSLLGRLASSGGGARAAVLTADPGMETHPAWSPDGRRVAYCARGRGAGERFHIFVKAPGGTAMALTSGDTNDTGPAWSPDGSLLAFARLSGDTVIYVVLPSGGGSEREVARFPLALDEAVPPRLVSWSRDGKALLATGGTGEEAPAILLLPLAGGAPRRVTNPPANSEGDFNPALSPDGATLAFTRRASTETEDLYLASLAGGEPRRLTFDEQRVRGLAWARNEIVYASSRFHDWRLHRISPASAKAKEIMGAGREAQFPAVAAKDGRLAWCRAPLVSNIWRAPLAGGEAAPLIVSTYREFAPRYSPEGKYIAYVSDRGTSQEVRVARADGTGSTPVTALAGAYVMRPAWAPGGRSLIFDVRTDLRSNIYVASVETGKTARATVLVEGGMAPSWSRDGRTIYYTSRGQIWQASADGRNPRPLSGFGNGPVESPDGRYVYHWGRGGIWRIPTAGGSGEQVVIEAGRTLGPGLALTAETVYYLKFDPGSRQIVLSAYDFESRASRTVRELPGFARHRAPTFDVSPDGRYVIYPRMEENEADIMTLDRLR